MQLKKLSILISVIFANATFAASADKTPEPISFLTDQKQTEVFWRQSNYNFSQIKSQINLILKSNLTNGYFRDKLKWLENHLTHQNIAFNSDNPYRFKNFIFVDKPYTAINLVSGASAPVGTLYLINENKINFSDELGHVISIDTRKTDNFLKYDELLIKTRLDGGTGSYNLSGILLKQDKNTINKIAVYPIHGFVSNPGVNLEYRVTRVVPDGVDEFKFIETITLVDDTNSSRKEFGFNKSLHKDFVVVMKKQKNKYVLADNQRNDQDPAFKVFANGWKK